MRLIERLVPKRRAAAAVVLAGTAAIVLSSCTTPGAQNLYMPRSGPYEEPHDGPVPSPTATFAPPDDLASDDTLPSYGSFVGEEATGAIAALRERGVDVRLADGRALGAVTSGEWQVAEQHLVTQESYPSTHYVLLTLERL